MVNLFKMISSIDLNRQSIDLVFDSEIARSAAASYLLWCAGTVNSVSGFRDYLTHSVVYLATVVGPFSKFS